MQSVLVIDAQGNPLMPCHPARARQLLREGRAAVWRREPFTIRLTERVGGETQPIAVKVDPGSKTTGIVLVSDTKRGKRVVWAGEVQHRGKQIKATLDARRAIRRGRRSRQTRYRPAHFANRRRKAEWLPPSVQSRVQNVITWVQRLRRLAPVASLSLERVKFDTQALQNPEISGVEYQQGELFGYEVREYLLEKWDRTCAYCGKTNIPLEIEHLIPMSRGGTNRIRNLTLACHVCNQRKGTQTAGEFGYPHLMQQAARPLKDAAAVNITRWILWQQLAKMELPLEGGTGGRTKYNRVLQNYPKAHWIDAACVGPSGEQVYLCPDHIPLLVKATGRGSRQMCRMDRFGFPRTRPKSSQKRLFGFQTGDLVQAVVPSGKHRGIHIGRVAVRASGAFRVGTVDGLSWRSCQLLQHSDGYEYTKGEGAFLPASSGGVSRAV